MTGKIIVPGCSAPPVRELHIVVDTREPELVAHPWARYFPRWVRLTQGTLATGDFALAGNTDGVVVERKSIPDLLSCFTHERDRFERELMRGRYMQRLITVCEGSLIDCIRAAMERKEEHGSAITPAAIVGSTVAMFLRFHGILFAGSCQCAAEFTWRILAMQLKDAGELVRRVARANREFLTA